NVEEVPRPRRAQAGNVVRGRRREAAPLDHAVAVAGPAVAYRAEDVEALPAALQHRFRDLQGELVPVGVLSPGGPRRGDERVLPHAGDNAADLGGPVGLAAPARVEGRVLFEVAARHRAGDELSGRAVVGEELARGQGAVARLPGHLLLAAADEGGAEE